MTSIRCRGVLFDLDGALVDSTPAVARVWAGWAQEHGFNPDEVVKKAHGRPSITTIRELLPHADHSVEDREVERRAIVTSCTRALANVRIAAAGLPWPRHLVTSTDVNHGKPDPEPYLKGAQMLGVPAKECIVIEDAPAGIRAGKAAGARVLALRTTASDAELQQAGADWIVDDCAGIFLHSSAADEDFLLLARRTK